MLAQWNTFPCPRWGISGQYMRVSHYGILLDDHAKSELLLQHSHMDQSQSQMVVVDQVRRVLELSTNDASYHQIIVVVPSPMLYFPFHHPWSLG
jgi:hypothetical protein